MLLQVLGRTGADPGRRRLARLFGGTGILGGFTTYSALATDTVRLWQTGSPAESAGYAVGTVLLGAIASVAGIAGGALFRRRAPR